MARRLNSLNIWLNGEFVGTWQRKGGDEELKYDDTWVNSERGRPLSLSLPFTPGNQTFRGDVVRFYFDNLLPDSRDIRDRLANKFSANSASPFDLLIELGRDCVGAIQLLNPDDVPEGVDTIICDPLKEIYIAEILRKTVSSNPLGHEGENGELRLSLAGAQEKTALLWYQDQWCLPRGATPTTHILKLPLGLVGHMKADMNQSVENEWLCSKIINAFGLPVAHCQIAQFEEQKTLVVERFDRKMSSDKNWIVRIPQEDMCQARGISPLRKYQCDNGPSIADCMRILSGSSEALADRQIFFSAQIIFWLLYATDGHAKNFSIQHHSKNSYELAPLYDVLSALPIIGKKHNQVAKQKAKLAMAIKGSHNYYLVNQIQRRHFIEQGTKVGFTPNISNQLIDLIINKTEQVIEEVSAIIPEQFPNSMAAIIFDGMLKQSKKLAV